MLYSIREGNERLSNYLSLIALMYDMPRPTGGRIQYMVLNVHNSHRSTGILSFFPQMAVSCGIGSSIENVIHTAKDL